ncbi:MAG: O-antigen ligase family protein [Thermodesulfobacteriota bacterium]|nr:O-antigen ligase family protein [Thermodesulfobacteriota bacterium]
MVIVIFLLLFRKNKVNFLKMFTPISIILLCFLLYFNYTSISENIKNLAAGRDLSLQQRIYYLKEATENFNLSFWGYGFGNIKIKSRKYDVISSYPDLKNTGGHISQRSGLDNCYLRVLFESGLLGLLILFLIFSVAFKTMFTLYNHKSISERDKSLIYAIFCIMLGYVLRNLTGDFFQCFPFNLYTWTFLGIIYNINFRLNYAEYEK